MVETEDKDPLLGIDEVSGDVMEGCFFHADRLSWMASCHLAYHHLALPSCHLFSMPF